MREETRYLCVAFVDRAERFFLWESDGVAPDRVVLDDDGFIVTYGSERAARQTAASTREGLSTDPPTVYDLDAIDAWCKSTAEIRDGTHLLNAWNLFGDLPRGESLYAAADVRANVIYDKLFFGCNLPAMTPPGEHYVPTWTATETAALKRLLLLGLAEFRSRLR